MFEFVKGIFFMELWRRCFWRLIFKAFALTGRKVDCWFTQGECPGLGASAPSGRVGHWPYYLLNYHFSKKHGIFPNNASIFPKKAPIFPKYSSLSGKVWGRLAGKWGYFLAFLLILCVFFLFFPAERVGFLFFPRNARFFPKSWVFRGSCGKTIVLPYFPQYFCSVEETRQRWNGLVLLKPLRPII